MPAYGQEELGRSPLSPSWNTALGSFHHGWLGRTPSVGALPLDSSTRNFVPVPVLLRGHPRVGLGLPSCPQLSAHDQARPSL